MLSALLARAGAGDVVADSGLCADELWRRAARVRSLLPPPTPGSMVAFAFAHDREALAAALLGTWLAGHGALLPEHSRRSAVAPVLALPEVVAFLHDTGAGTGIDVPALLAAAPAAAAPTAAAAAAATAAAGNAAAGAAPPPRRGPLLVAHALDGRRQTFDERSLLAAVDELALRLRPQAGSLVEGNLSPHFLPALLAALLLPLRAGARFTARIPGADAASLAAAARVRGAGTLLCAAATLPALLRLDADALAGVRRIGCTGAPSPAATAALQQRGIAVVELPLDDEPADLLARRERLLTLPHVLDAEVLPLPAGAGSAMLAAVAAPPHQAAAVAAAAAAALPPVAELCVLPALPRDPNGRLPAVELFAACGRADDGMPCERQLQWRPLPAADDGAQRFATTLPRRWQYFAGHFRGHPVLAGAVQLQQLVLPCLRRAHADAGALRQVEQVKFQARINPGDDVEVVLLRRGPQAFAFEIRSKGTLCSSGQLLCGGDGGATG